MIKRGKFIHCLRNVIKTMLYINNISCFKYMCAYVIGKHVFDLKIYYNISF